jgi:hypothetical protein
MKIAVKLFALVTVAFGLNEATKPEHELDYSQEMAHSQKVIDSTLENLLYIHRVNDSLIDKYFPYEEDNGDVQRSAR